MKKLFLLLVLVVFFVPATIVQAEESDGMLYGIGSTSKVFTAAAVIRLVDMGLVDLDTPVINYIPDFTMADARYGYITPRMLLDHSSGIMGSTLGNAMLLGDNSRYYFDNFLNMLSQQRLMFHPGERSIYNNDGFTLAEVLIERVSGVTFTEFLDREFFQPLGIENIVSPQSDFDPNRVAGTYLAGSRLQPESLGVIGSGGLLATMEDLAVFSTIFMDSADGSILSRQSVDEMARNQTQMDMMEGSSTNFRYGLGWDSIDLFPFNALGIQALSKGGTTAGFHTDLTVLPEFNLAVSISASGNDAFVQTIAQAIILEVLMEEGLLPQSTTITLPELNREPARIPDSVRANAGIFDSGVMRETFHVDFTDYTMVMTPIAAATDRPLVFLHNTDGKFVSIDGNSLGGMTGDSVYTISILTFYENYILGQSFSDIPGIGIVAQAGAHAQRLEPRVISSNAQTSWDTRNDREFLLVSPRHTSTMYFSPVLSIQTDSQIHGYVTSHHESQVIFPTLQIIDENHATAFISIPLMNGRDAVDLSVTNINGVEFMDMHSGDRVFMCATGAVQFSTLGNSVNIVNNTIWADIDPQHAGQTINIFTPQNGAWFIYDNRMNPIATSLEQNPRESIILPEGGRIAFAGEAGAMFTIQ
ncbi:MAG: beta-lactamase family protein [Defluviitaleaceae bacterium]|nr:beta-lactamase family protein [Defluviitaleaceae bacterium]